MVKQMAGYRIKGFYLNLKKEEYVSKTVYRTKKEALGWLYAYKPAYRKTWIVFEDVGINIRKVKP